MGKVGIKAQEQSRVKHHSGVLGDEEGGHGYNRNNT